MTIEQSAGSDGVARCECGCGLPAPTAKKTDRRQGWAKGQQKRFVTGHNARLRESRERLRAAMSGENSPHWGKRGAETTQWKGSEATYRSVHEWLRKRYPPTGVCEDCGSEGKTHYAFTRHPEPPTRDRGDYRELCPSCHLRLDEPITRRAAKMRAGAPVSFGRGQLRRRRVLARAPTELERGADQHRDHQQAL